MDFINFDNIMYKVKTYFHSIVEEETRLKLIFLITPILSTNTL